MTEVVRPVQTRRWRHNPQEKGLVGLKESGDCMMEQINVQYCVKRVRKEEMPAMILL